MYFGLHCNEFDIFFKYINLALKRSLCTFLQNKGIKQKFSKSCGCGMLSSLDTKVLSRAPEMFRLCELANFRWFRVASRGRAAIAVDAMTFYDKFHTCWKTILPQFEL